MRLHIIYSKLSKELMFYAECCISQFAVLRSRVVPSGCQHQPRGLCFLVHLHWSRLRGTSSNAEPSMGTAIFGDLVQILSSRRIPM